MMSNSDRWTAKRLSAMEKRLDSIYKEAYKDLDEKTKAHFAKMAEMDEKKKKLVENGKLSQEEYERWRRTQLFQGQQMQAMTDAVAEELLKVNQTAIAYVNGQLPSVYTVNYNDAGKDIAGKVSGYSFQLYDEQTVMNLATENKTLLPYKQVNGKKDVRWNTKQVNAQVLQGIIQGESIPKIAKRLEKVTDMNKVSAIRNARTSVTSAQNKGRIDSYRQAQKDGVILKKQWLAANQPGRTRDWHFELDEAEAEVDEPFKNSFGEIMYPGDPHAKPQNVYNCRCTLVSIVKGFKKVGENTAENVDNTAESGIMELKRTFQRKDSNIGAFSNLQIPMQKKEVKRIAQAYGIDLSGLTIKIQRSEKLLSFSITGSTDYQNIGRIDLFPNAFIDEECLVRTLVHEKCHVQQLKRYGVQYVQENLDKMEMEAYRFEDEWFKTLKKVK